MVERDAVDHVRRDLEARVVCAGLELSPKGLETLRVVELVAVDCKNPCARAGVRLDHSMRVGRLARTPNVEVVVLTCQATEDSPCAVGRNVIDRVDRI